MPRTPGSQRWNNHALRQHDKPSSGVRSNQELTATLDKRPQQVDMSDVRLQQEGEAVRTAFFLENLKAQGQMTTEEDSSRGTRLTVCSSLGVTCSGWRKGIRLEEIRASMAT